MTFCEFDVYAEADEVVVVTDEFNGRCNGGAEACKEFCLEVVDELPPSGELLALPIELFFGVVCCDLMAIFRGSATSRTSFMSYPDSATIARIDSLARLLANFCQKILGLFNKNKLKNYTNLLICLFICQHATFI